MRQRFKILWKHNLVFNTGSLIFLCAAVLLYLSLGKREAFLLINHSWHPLLDRLMPWLTFLGDGWLVLVVIFIYTFKNIRIQASLLVSWLISIVIVQSLKNLVFHERLRPFGFFSDHRQFHYLKDIDMHSMFSFPSGHTACAFAMWGTLALFSQSKSVRVLCLLCALVAGWSRIYLAQHFIEDVAAGSFIGLISIYMGALLTWKLPHNQSFIQYIKS